MGCREYIARIEEARGAADVDAAQAKADVLMTASWLARHGEQPRAKVLAAAVDTLSTAITKAALGRASLPRGR